MNAEDIEDSSAPLIEHLIELRTRIVRSLIAFIVGMCIAFALYQQIFNFLTQPICSALSSRGQGCDLIMVKLQEGFFVAVRISVLGGFMLSFPYIASQLWRFVAPVFIKLKKTPFCSF